MPVTVNEVQGLLGIPTTWADRAISIIDTKLRDAQYVRDWRCGVKENPFYRFSISGTATEGDKKKVIDAYLQAGWAEVSVTNSEESSERAGMVGVMLTMYPEKVKE